ncbi:hypothetical protein P171DRAFT_485351 [Karstenula rhodostoma CBS 690.94]|uniref:C2H2-type domain-containing protein n=1 Tax=Karstenula rhodostoma CBS 690.94 TaxID=1392251 RepID=A0A9P4PJH0_9PLEO|nr:hypothetical protein P171DRAFT_485351 [Karstenula rhodostoma CBS 690.94]
MSSTPTSISKYTFRGPTHMTRHRDATHAPFKCPKCDYIAATYGSLRTHIDVVKENKASKKQSKDKERCGMGCGKKYCTKAARNRHEEGCEYRKVGDVGGGDTATK